jgi:hypothetical protein
MNLTALGAVLTVLNICHKGRIRIAVFPWWTASTFIGWHGYYGRSETIFLASFYHIINGVYTQLHFLVVWLV